MRDPFPSRLAETSGQSAPSGGRARGESTEPLAGSGHGTGSGHNAESGSTTGTGSSRTDRGVEPDAAALADTIHRIAANVERVVVGKPEVVRIALITLLSQGHLLIEDVPGVGKTSLAKALARSIDCSVSRIQFTPDLLPSDVTGVSVYDRNSDSFEFHPGAVFANIVVGDEINRASPKTQSALLECMEEDQVTVDGQTYPLAAPFMVVATQNPVELEGTYALPEAQRDRFTARVSVGYPTAEAELAMVDEHSGHQPLEELSPVTDAERVHELARAVRVIHISTELRRYAVELVAGTRSLSELRLGASPRATLHLVRAARAHAALSGRSYVIPDDLHEIAVPVLAHRLVLTSEARSARKSAAELVRRLLRDVPVPRNAG
ncbi:AAA family ATPase [Salinifilum ghardaiensis]